MKYTFNELTFWEKHKLAILVTIFVIIIIAVILYFTLKPSSNSDHSSGSTPPSTISPRPSIPDEDMDPRPQPMQLSAACLRSNQNTDW